MDQLRPPYVDFERRPVEDRTRSIAEGIYATRDEDYILLVPHGSEGKTRLEYVYEDWKKRVRPATRGQGLNADGHYEVAVRFPAEWLDKIENQYQLWKKGESLEVEGTPVKLWPGASPGQKKALLDLHILSVEELAAAADDAVERLGMGGIALRQRARDWLGSQKAPDSVKVAAQLAAAQVEIQNRDVRIASLEEQQKAMQAQITALIAAAKVQTK